MPLPDGNRALEARTERPRASVVKRLWMGSMPGLTQELLEIAYENACKPEKLFVGSQMVNLSPDQWAQLEDYCRRSLNLPQNWQDLRYKEVVEQAKKEGWMSKYGPNPVINKKKLKADQDVKSTQKNVDANQAQLF